MIRRFSGTMSEISYGPFAVYYDPHYDCAMELLRFKTQPAERYAGFVADAKFKLSKVEPIRRDSMLVTLPLVA